jgi:hypothetical protein
MARGNCRLLAVLALLAAAPSRVDALDLGLPGESIDVHGFASQGFIKTNANNYLAQSKRGSFEFTEVGINFTKELTDNLRLGIQLFSRRLGLRRFQRSV